MEYENIGLIGYSHRAQSPEFRGLFKEKQQKVTIKSLRWAVVFFVLTLAAILTIVYSNNYIDTHTDAEGAAWVIIGAFMSMLVVGVLFIINGIITALSAAIAAKIPKMSSVDCVVTERKQWVTTSSDDRGHETKDNNYRITLETGEGKKIKISGNQAMVVLPYVKDGDKVRYHKGFTYPVELFDKSQTNICVFCGECNNPKNNTCDKCQKPMPV